MAAKAVDRSSLSAPFEQPEFDAVYRTWFHEVSRWARALGGAEAELEDLTQEVFMIVRRRLPDFNGGNLAGWLYTITSRTVKDHRRNAWFRNIFSRPREVDLDKMEAGGGTPAEAIERRQAEHALFQLLERMSEKRRAAFVLFEIEGYSGEEIAALEGVPVATIWTRLHHARKEFLSLVARFQKKERV